MGAQPQSYQKRVYHRCGQETEKAKVRLEKPYYLSKTNVRNQRGTKMRPISKEAVAKRLSFSGLTIAKAMMMSDDELLRFPMIGRRTLRYIRNFEPIQT